MSITQNLKDIRMDHEDSQQDIAEVLQITRQQYQLYESGKRTIPIDLLQVFCEHYNVSADYILDLPNNLDWPRTKKRLPKEPKISDIQRANAVRNRQIRMEQLQAQKLEIDLD